MRAQRHQAQLAGRYGATPFNIRDIAPVGQGLALRIGAHALRAAERELLRRIQILARRLSAQNAMHGPAIGRAQMPLAASLHLPNASWVRPAAWSSELAAGVSMSSSPLGWPAKIRGRSGPFQAPPASVRRSFGARSHDHSRVHHRCRAVDSRLIPHAKTIDPSWTFWGRVLPGRVGNQLNGSIGSGSEFHLYVPRHD